MLRILPVLLAAAILTAAVMPAEASTTAASDPARAELRGIVENVAGATAKRYGVKDDAGHVMDTVKIIQVSNGGFVLAWEQEQPGGGNHSILGYKFGLIEGQYTKGDILTALSVLSVLARQDDHRPAQRARERQTAWVGRGSAW